MPVTFETDLRDLKDQPYVQQIPLDAMFRGMGYKQAEWDQGVQQAKSITQNAANLLRGYGPDEQAAADIRDQLNQQVQAFAGQDFSRPDVVNQFNSYINGVLNSPDVRGIVSRTAKREADQRLLREYQDKGKEVPLWLQPSVQQAQAYEASGKYDPNVRYRGEITIAPDVKGWLRDVSDKVQPDIDEHGNKFVSKEKYEAALRADLKFHPEMEQYLRLEHESKFPQGHNWDEHATEVFNNVADANDAKFVEWSAIANSARAEAEKAHRGKDQRAYEEALAKYQKANEIAQLAGVAAKDAREKAVSRDKGHFLQQKSQEEYINGVIGDWADAHAYTQHGMSEQEKLMFQRQTEYGAIALRNKGAKDIEQMKLDATTGGGLAPTILLNQFYDAIAGRTPEGGIIDAPLLAKDATYSAANPVTAATLQEKFDVPNAANTAGKDSWIPIGSVPEVVRKALDTEADRDANGNIVRQSNLAIDDKGNYLIFRSADGKKLGFVKQIYNRDSDETVRQFEVMDETSAKTKGAVGKSLKEQQILANRTQDAYEAERAARAAGGGNDFPAPPRPAAKAGFRDFYIPGKAKPFQIPTDQVNDFLKDNPTAKSY